MLQRTKYKFRILKDYVGRHRDYTKRLNITANHARYKVSTKDRKRVVAAIHRMNEKHRVRLINAKRSAALTAEKIHAGGQVSTARVSNYI